MDATILGHVMRAFMVKPFLVVFEGNWQLKYVLLVEPVQSWTENDW